jgi:hypothetical protein
MIAKQQLRIEDAEHLSNRNTVAPAINFPTEYNEIQQNTPFAEISFRVQVVLRPPTQSSKAGKFPRGANRPTSSLPSG